MGWVGGLAEPPAPWGERAFEGRGAKKVQGFCWHQGPQAKREGGRKGKWRTELPGPLGRKDLGRMENAPLTFSSPRAVSLVLSPNVTFLVCPRALPRGIQPPGREEVHGPACPRHGAVPGALDARCPHARPQAVASWRTGPWSHRARAGTHWGVYPKTGLLGTGTSLNTLMPWGKWK